MAGVLHPDPAARPDTAESDHEVIEVPDLETALAMALACCPDGETISVHEEHCPVTPERPEDCNCNAQVYRPVRA